jgi:hypothetical protein
MKFYWKVPNSDDFDNASEWTPSEVPGASDQAFLTGTGTGYDVNVLGGESETVLTISTSADAILNIIQSSTFTAEAGTGSGANNGSIQVSDGSSFDVAGTINNPGTIQLLGTSTGGALVLLGDTTLNGGGSLTLSDATGGNTIDGAGTLTNNSGINGAGKIEVAIVNKTTVLPGGNIIPAIEGNSGSNTLELDGVVTNTGDLDGEGAAGLLIQNNVNNIGGLIDASGGKVEIDKAATIVGGILQNAGGTFIIANANLDGSGTHPITFFGDIAAATGQNLFTQGAFQNSNGPADFLDLKSGSSLLLGFSNATGIDSTFSGGGQIVLTNAAIYLNALTHVGGTPLKLNNVNDEIIGTGTIGNAIKPGSFVLNNETKGVVEALNGDLTIYSNITNAGVLDSTNGDLKLFDSVVTNTGSIKAEAGAAVDLGATIRGGTLAGAGTIFLDGAVLDGSGSALTNAGYLLLHQATDATLKGTINNTGTLELGLPSGGTGGVPTLVIGAAGTLTQVTLKGSGTIVLDAYGEDYIDGAADFPGGVPTTLDNVSNTIEGTGRIGDGGLTLKNSGTIDADSTSPLVIDTGARTVTNTGTLQGFDSSTLYIASPLNNTGGKLSAVHDGELIADRGSSGGTAATGQGGIIEFGGPTTTAVQFADAGFESSSLVLDDSVHFKGTISGFDKVSTDDQIDLLDIDPATAHKVSYASGVLTIKDGEGHTAQLHFSGTYTLASFNLNDDGHSGTLLTDPPVAPHAPPAAPPASPILFGNYIAALFPAAGEPFGGLLAKHETVAQPLLALPHG